MSAAHANATPPRKRHWANIGEVTSVNGIKLLFVIHRIFGRWPFRIVVYPAMLFYILRHPLARRSSQAYLNRVYGSMSGNTRSATLWDSVRHFAAFAENILDKLRIWAGELTPKDVQFHDYHVIQEPMNAGKGGLIMVTHLGNVEVLRALTTRKNGIRLNVLVHTKHAESFNRMLAELDPASTLNIVQVTDVSADTVIRLRERVDRGEYIVIAGDRVPISDTPRVAPAPFLGATAGFPVGPYVLASLLQCPIYLLFCIPQRGQHHAYFENFRDRVVLPRASRETALRELAAEFAERLAHYCRIAPLQWFNFYDFWDMSHLPAGYPAAPTTAADVAH
jgi:predicted LPLAT superfamily acyltransferase